MLQTYQQAVDYLYQNVPMFQRIGAAAIKKDLTNTRKLCAALGNPQNGFKPIHIAGTNGKGSTAHMLAAILQSASYKTGLYTSPHLKNFTERIRVDGQEIREQFVVDFVNKLVPTIEAIQPSFFEITVAMAFDYFAQQNVDVAVIEVGLGGRLDSTNIIQPVLSVITNIGWDHTDILGDTLHQIAFEKAGIIKHEVPVVVSERQPDIDAVFIHKAQAEQAPLTFASDHYQVTKKNDKVTIDHDGTRYTDALSIPLTGNYQQRNIAGVVAAVDVLKKIDFDISEQAFRAGMENVTALTGLKGRWQTLGERPLVICDTGHNVDGIRQVMEQIRSLSYDHLHIVFGMVKDKDSAPVLALLPKQARYYFCQATIPRALDAAELTMRAKEFGLIGEAIRDVNEAINTAIGNAHENDLVFIGGSTFVVAEIEGL